MNLTKEETGVKNVKLRVIAFIITVLIAVGAFTVGIVSFNSREEGWYELKANPAEDGTLYFAGVHAYAFMEGKSNAIRQETRLVTAAYSQALEWCFKQFDPVNTYDGYVNVASLNRNPGAWLPVSSELFSALKRAQALCETHEGCSLFSGELYRSWEELLYLLAPADTDPANNADTAARLQAIAAASSEENAFSLEFRGENEVRFTVSDGWKKAAADLELAEASPLDLGLLKDAFLLEHVANALSEQGFEKILLTADSGVMVISPAAGETTLDLLGYVNGAAEALQSIPFNGGTAVSLCKAFPGKDETDGYYAVEKDGKTLLRSLHFDPASGEVPDDVLSVYAVKENAAASDLPALACASLDFFLGKESPKPAGTTLWYTLKTAPDKFLKK